MLSTLLHILYVPVCLFLILVVLLQTGKRADLAGAFGGGGSQTAFGARGAATLLAKVTTGSAVLFMVIALTLSILTAKQESGATVLDEVPEPADTSAPVEAPLVPSDQGAVEETAPTSESESPVSDVAEPAQDADAPEEDTEQP